MARDPDLLHLHRRLRLRAVGAAARDLPRAARPRHGRRVGDRRGAGVRIVSGAATAARRSRSCRARGRSATASLRWSTCSSCRLGLARRLLRRRASGAVHDLDPPQRRGAEDLASTAPRPIAAASALLFTPAIAPITIVRDADERLHAVRLVGAQQLGAGVSRARSRARRHRPVLVGDVAVRDR